MIKIDSVNDILVHKDKLLEVAKSFDLAASK